MLPVEPEWDDEGRPRDLGGENHYYAKDLRKPCPTSVPPAQSRSTLRTRLYQFGASQHAKNAARTTADGLGWIADQFTHLAFIFFRRPRWTAINRLSFVLLHRLSQRFDRAAIWFLLRSR